MTVIGWLHGWLPVLCAFPGEAGKGGTSTEGGAHLHRLTDPALSRQLGHQQVESPHRLASTVGLRAQCESSCRDLGHEQQVQGLQKSRMSRELV